MVSSALAEWAANVMSRKAAHATPTLHLGRKRSLRVIGSLWWATLPEVVSPRNSI
jgi:hypothetical protein